MGMMTNAEKDGLAQHLEAEYKMHRLFVHEYGLLDQAAGEALDAQAVEDLEALDAQAVEDLEALEAQVMQEIGQQYSDENVSSSKIIATNSE
jgi:hypothetical protein